MKNCNDCPALKDKCICRIYNEVKDRNALTDLACRLTIDEINEILNKKNISKNLN